MKRSKPIVFRFRVNRDEDLQTNARLRQAHPGCHSLARGRHPQVIASSHCSASVHELAKTLL